MKEAPKKQCSHTLGGEDAVLVWSAAARSLFCGVNNPASPGWEPDCVVSLQLSGNPSVKSDKSILLYRRFTSGFIHRGCCWGHNPGQCRGGSISLNLSLHESTTYSLPEEPNNLFLPHGSELSKQASKQKVLLFFFPTAPIKSWTCNIYVKAVRTAVVRRLVSPTLGAVVNGLVKTKVLKESRDVDYIGPRGRSPWVALALQRNKHPNVPLCRPFVCQIRSAEPRTPAELRSEQRLSATQVEWNIKCWAAFANADTRQRQEPCTHDINSLLQRQLSELQHGLDSIIDVDS